MKYASLILVVSCLACTKQPAQDATQSAGKATPSAGVDAPPDEAPSTQPLGDPHVVVFADRTSQAYLLLLPPEQATAPTREQLQTLVKAKLATAADEPELELLLQLIATEPKPDLSGPQLDGAPRAARDLLGLDIDVLEVTGTKGAVGQASLQDPVLTRALTPEQRASLPARTKAVMLRASYRNRFAVRGLRLLQTLTRVVASERDALVYDPDTGETVGVETFTQRRLKSSLHNIAEQIAVVPFLDKTNPDGVRLTTRGMRRFGSPDLELDGLPRDPAVLQRATDLLNGLAANMVVLGEFDSTGYAVELDQLVEVEVDDVRRAYGNDAEHVPDCGASCPGGTVVHLVERPAEPHDPTDHVVVRVIAPRERSDSVDYDHETWVRESLNDVFGPNPVATP